MQRIAFIPVEWLEHAAFTLGRTGQRVVCRAYLIGIDRRIADRRSLDRRLLDRGQHGTS
jgi:hypothetical protein